MEIPSCPKSSSAKSKKRKVDRHHQQLPRFTSSLEVFPPEIWLMIVHQTDDYDDAIRIFQAFPELLPVADWKKIPCIIGGIMPHILSKFLNYNDILNCRLVSKRWKKAVETALEVHPDRLPYQSARLSILTENHFSYHPLPKIQTKLRRLMRSTRKIYNRLNSNPFTGRYLDLIVKDSKGRGAPTSVYFWEAIEMLKNFGKHIWYIRFGLQMDNKNEHQCIELFQGLLECLLHLPNLKSLKIDIQPSNDNSVFCGEIDPNDIAEIPAAHLEALDFIGFIGVHSSLCYDLAALFQPNAVQRLELLLDSWDKRYSSRFKNLTELHLKCSSDLEDPLPKIAQILCEMNPNFTGKLKISGGSMYIHDLLEVLSPHKVQALDTEGATLIENPCRSSIVLPSLKELRLTDDKNLHFHFLKALKCLEYLGVKTDVKTCRLKKQLPYARFIRSYFYLNPDRISGWSVWTNLRSLKLLREFNSGRIFAREYGNELFTRTIMP